MNRWTLKKKVNKFEKGLSRILIKKKIFQLRAKYSVGQGLFFLNHKACSSGRDQQTDISIESDMCQNTKG
jgi:hypothetical protein